MLEKGGEWMFFDIRIEIQNEDGSTLDSFEEVKCHIRSAFKGKKVWIDLLNVD